MNDLHADLERLRDDLAAYALGALPPDESVELEHHLEQCESCRGRLRWLRPAVDTLPVAVEQLEPPPGLRDRLLATVREEARSEAAELSEANEQRTRPTFLDRLRPVFLRPAAGFAAVLLLIAGAGVGWLVRGDDDGGTPADSQFVESEPLSKAPASATLELHGDSATLHVHDLPQLERDRVYEVWVQRAGVMEPSTTFVLQRDGSAAAAIPGPLEGAEGIYVTTEPRGGSRQPTTKPLLTASLN